MTLLNLMSDLKLNTKTKRKKIKENKEVIKLKMKY